jgi:LuxR family maltose regulon positive regulatory protein
MNMTSTTSPAATAARAPATEPASAGPGTTRPAAAGPAPAPGALLADKLHIPHPSLPLLHRTRLTGQIEAAAGQRVTLVSGPAGAGKTLALAAWAAATPSARRVAWLTLDATDRDPARFWSYVEAALAGAGALPAGALTAGALHAGARAAGAAAVPSGGAAEPGSGEPADGPGLGPDPELAGQSASGPAVRLVEAAQRLTGQVVLILDDVHELAGGAVLPELDVLIRHAPAGLRLILSGRCAPGLQLARLRLHGDLADIGAADLACTPPEADQYFALLHLDIAASERDEVLRRTEGWMAGLRLAALRAWAPGSDGHPAGLAGDEPLVADYVWDEVLGSQPADTRQFLLRTSVAERVSGALADELTGQPGGVLTLERLSRESGLIEPLSTDRTEYRYHPLLREALSAELRRQLPDEIPGLLRQAARWYAGQGRPAAAIRAAAQAEDWDGAARVLATDGLAALLGPEAAALEQALALLPAERGGQDGAVAAALATVRLRQGDLSGAGHYLDLARPGLERYDPPQRRVLEPWLAAVRILAGSAGPGAGPELLARGTALARSGQQAAGTRPEYQAVGLLWFALGVARLRRWETGPARDALARAAQQLTAGGLAAAAARAAGWQAVTAAWYGDLAQAEQAARGLTGPADPAAPALAALAVALIALGRDDLAMAQSRLDEAGLELPGPMPGEPAWATVTGLTRARLLLAQGDTAGARGLVLSLRDRQAATDPALDGVLRVLDGEIALRAGDLSRARTVLAAVEDSEWFGRADGQLARARLLLADGDVKGALEAAGPCLDGTADALTLRDKIGALVISAVAHRRLGLPETATEVVDEALALAEPDHAFRVFLDAGQPARSAITVLVPPVSRGAAFAGRILERFDIQLPRTEGLAGRMQVPLTESELAVLRFLPSHMTNQEIAEALFLSINTVKTHLRSVYRKLGVATRREAIARGKRLDLV